ncbi:pentapeptide repeat-containing protein [Enterobacter sp. Sphag1F]|jgi:uncharacterized protein YjbI with pentapeptide repeats|uniref:pentapeptide repeat-containing protein n=2 Tax=Gammaproteobacteria TaxID=1236 RepID=UPI0009DA430F|nr:pentapeptide repeat-containing protein [Enterobacter sp. Sphag1F]KAJ9430495.1 pentapeptide repeat-containing protein [Pantoea sp. YR343]
MSAHHLLPVNQWSNTMNLSQLEIILRAHKIWVRSEGQKGKRADLSFMDLRGAPLDNADLTRAIMIGANLQGASLNNTLLCRAFMPFADLSGTTLLNTDFSHAKLMAANLRDADMRTARLEGADLQGAMTGGTRLPDSSTKASLKMVVIEILVIRR